MVGSFSVNPTVPVRKDYLLSDVHCVKAVAKLEKRLNSLPHPDGLVRMVMFDHDSPGLKKLRKQIAEAVVLLFENDDEILREFCELI